MVAKAELHVHLEGTIRPQLAFEIAKDNGKNLPKDLVDENQVYRWDDFLGFLKAYDVASQVLTSGKDYYRITYDYLKTCAESNTLYVEMMSSPDHAALCGISYQDFLAGQIDAIDEAREKHGIEGRIITTCVRHFGVEACEKVARLAEKNQHPYVVGFGMGGDEAGFPPGQFAKAYQIAHEGAGLQCTTHAGEMVGPEGMWEAIDNLPITRIGHGVRCIEDPKLMQEIKDRNICLEVCPGSNIALGVYPSFAKHPLLKLLDAGITVTLNSDDPPFFATSIDNEYRLGKSEFGLSDEQLKQITRNAINTSFVDDKLKQSLLDRIS